jgi:hypothetical protein
VMSDVDRARDATALWKNLMVMTFCFGVVGVGSAVGS